MKGMNREMIGSWLKVYCCSIVIVSTYFTIMIGVLCLRLVFVAENTTASTTATVSTASTTVTTAPTAAQTTGTFHITLTQTQTLLSDKTISSPGLDLSLIHI